MKNYIIIILSFLSLVGFGQTASFLSNFEDQNTTPEIGEANYEMYEGDTFYVVPNPHVDEFNSSNYVLKLSTDEGTRSRAEYDAWRLPTDEKTYIYAWKRYHSANMFKDINMQWAVINQWKTWPCETYGTGDVYGIFNETISYPDNGGIFNETRMIDSSTYAYLSRAEPDRRADFYQVNQGYWQQFVMEIYWTNTEDGYYRVWKNDTLLAYGDHMKTLMDGFIPGNDFNEDGNRECDMYWSTGLYVSWSKTGNESQDFLSAYIDDVTIYDIDSGYTVNSLFPSAQAAPEVPSGDSNVYKINFYGIFDEDGYNNYVEYYNRDSFMLDLSNTYGQGSDIDFIMDDIDGNVKTTNLWSDECFPTNVINTYLTWYNNSTYTIELTGLTKFNTYTVRALGVGNTENQGLQIWTTEANRDTVMLYGNTCNMAELDSIVPDYYGSITIYMSATNTTYSRPFLNAIEITEYIKQDTTYCDSVTITVNSDITGSYGSDGAINLSVSAPQTVTHNWSNSDITEDITELSPGIFADTITMVDSGCVFIEQFIVTELDPCDTTNIIIAATITDRTEESYGSIDVTISGEGSSPYTYLWSNSETTQDITDLVVGAYGVTVTDVNGCINDSSFFISGVLDTLRIDYGPTAVDGWIQVNSPSVTYGLYTIESYYLNSGTYGTKHVSYPNGVQDYIYGTEYYDSISTLITGLTMNSATVEVFVSRNTTTPRYVSLWINNDSIAYINFSSNDESVIVNNVVVDDSIRVTIKQEGAEWLYLNAIVIYESASVSYCDTVTFSASAAITDAYESEGAINQTVISPRAVTHSWSNSASTEDLTGLIAGTYRDTITMADSGCVIIKSYIVDQLEPCDTVNYVVTADLTNVTTYGGSDGAIDLTVSGGVAPYTYLWSNAAETQDLTGLIAGNYSITIYDDNVCPYTNDWDITQPAYVPGSSRIYKLIVPSSGDKMYYYNGKPVTQ